MSTKTSDDVLLHYGRKGQKWYHHIFSSVRSGTGRRRKANQQNTPHSHKTSKRKKRGPVDELQREREIIELYRNRDKVSTKVLKNKIARIESERKLKELAEAPGKARAEALQKKRQARLKFVGKVISSGIDVYSKIPSSVATRKIDKNNKDAIDKAIKDFKLRQEWAKAFKDVPITMTNFTQSVNIRGVDVYIPESIQKKTTLMQYGKKGMKWKRRKSRLSDILNNLTEDVTWEVDKYHIQSHINEASKDVQTAEKNMADNISKIKSNVRNGKTADKAEQKYLDIYKRNVEAAKKASEVLELRRKHLKDMTAAHLKDLKDRGK